MGRDLNRQQCVQAVGYLILKVLIQVPVAIQRKVRPALGMKELFGDGRVPGPD